MNHPDQLLQNSENSNARIKWKTAFEIIGIFVVAKVFITVLQPLTKGNLLFNQGIVWLAYMLMLSLIWLGLHLRSQNWTHLGWQFPPKNLLRIILLSFVVFIAGIAAFLIGGALFSNLQGMPEAADMSQYDYIKGNLKLLIPILIGVYIASSFGEEVIYRAFLITRISELGSNKKIAEYFALVISSVIFGLAHFQWGILGIIQTTFMGFALGVCYLLFKRNLWINVLAHAYMDTILILQMYFGD